MTNKERQNSALSCFSVPLNITISIQVLRMTGVHHTRCWNRLEFQTSGNHTTTYCDSTMEFPEKFTTSPVSFLNIYFTKCSQYDRGTFWIRVQGRFEAIVHSVEDLNWALVQIVFDVTSPSCLILTAFQHLHVQCWNRTGANRSHLCPITKPDDNVSLDERFDTHQPLGLLFSQGNCSFDT